MYQDDSDYDDIKGREGGGGRGGGAVALILLLKLGDDREGIRWTRLHSMPLSPSFLPQTLSGTNACSLAG